MSKLSPHELGAFLREQRQAAQLSLRQLSDLAGISNPYLSQIERGLKKPSAEILQQLARGLQVSAESLYVHAGILDAAPAASDAPGVLEAIAADPALTPRQRAVLVDVYASFVGPGTTGTTGATDAGTTGTGTTDAGTTDAGATDAGTTGTGMTDAGATGTGATGTTTDPGAPAPAPRSAPSRRRPRPTSR